MEDYEKKLKEGESILASRLTQLNTERD